MNRYFDIIAHRAMEDAKIRIGYGRNIGGDDGMAFLMAEIDAISIDPEPTTTTTDTTRRTMKLETIEDLEELLAMEGITDADIGEDVAPPPPEPTVVNPALLDAVRADVAKRAAGRKRAKLTPEERAATAREKARLRVAKHRACKKAEAPAPASVTAPASVSIITAAEALGRINDWIASAPTAPAQRRVKNDAARLDLYARGAALLSETPDMPLSQIAAALGIKRPAAQNIRDFVRRNAAIFS